MSVFRSRGAASRRGPAFSVLLAALAALLFSSGASAEQLRFATGSAPNSIGGLSAEQFAKSLKEHSGGDLTAKVYMMSLLSFAEMSGGVEKGMTDIGSMIYPYFPSEYPRTNLVAELTMLTDLMGAPKSLSNHAYAGAVSEFVFEHCPECVAEWEAHDHVFSGGSAASPYYFLCNKPVDTLKDLSDKRVRVGGAQWARAAEALGATPVTMSVNEIYEGLSQGAVDCTMQAAAELISFNLMEVTTDITLGAPLGIYGGLSLSTNRKVWQGLTEAQRKALLHAAADSNAHTTWGYRIDDERALKEAKEKGIAMHEADDAMVTTAEQFIEKDMETIAANYQKKYGVDDAAEMIATFRPLLEKWMTLVKDVDSSEALADLYWNEIYSKVDVSQYGL